MTDRHPFKRAGRVWRVIGVTSDPERPEVMIGVRTLGGFGADCGHYHGSQGEAEACPWEPENPPTEYAGIVRQVRDDREDRKRYQQGTMPWA